MERSGNFYKATINAMMIMIVVTVVSAMISLIFNSKTIPL